MLWNSQFALIATATLGLATERLKLACFLLIRAFLEPGAPRAVCFGVFEECDGTLSIILVISSSKMFWTSGLPGELKMEI